MTATDFANLRATLGYTETQLARALGVTQTAISRWETGGRPIPAMASRLLQIAAHAPAIREWMEKQGRGK